MGKKVILAFSGGLDTSYCAKYLQQEQGLEVHSVFVNTGSHTAKEMHMLKAQANALGVDAHTNLELTEEYYRQGIRYLLFGNVLRNHTYPLSVSAERSFQARAIAAFARQSGADYLAHGSTGAGNDQVRFDLIFQTIAPELNIMAPVRDQHVSRDEEINYLQQHGYHYGWRKARYSVNKGLWGTSIGGQETLTSHQPLPEDAFPGNAKKQEAQKITIEFRQGEPYELNGQNTGEPVPIIRELNALGESYGIGRGIHTGDTILGIKGRVGFEAPAAMILIQAHQALEKHTLTKWQQYWKDQLATWYGMLFHEAQYPAPVMRNIETFLADTQERVTGKVYLRLMPYHAETEGIKSPYDLMRSEFADYGEMNQAWNGKDVEGFTRILSNYIKTTNFA